MMEESDLEVFCVFCTGIPFSLFFLIPAFEVGSCVELRVLWVWLSGFEIGVVC